MIGRVGKTIGLGLILIGAGFRNEGFVFNAEAISKSAVYYGSIPESGLINDPRIVLRSELIEQTPEYKQISKEKIKENSAKYQILIESASRRTIKWIKNYAEKEKPDVIFEKARLNPEAFLEIPKTYEGYSIDELINQLDVTEDLLRDYAKN